MKTAAKFLKPDKLQLQVYVQPGGKKNEFLGLYDQQMKIRIKAPPVDGKANHVLIEYFAEIFSVTKKSVNIVSGQLSRSKVLVIDGIDAASVAETLKKFNINI